VADRTGACGPGRPPPTRACGDVENTRGASAGSTGAGRAFGRAGRIHANVPARRRARSAAGSVAAGRVYTDVSGIPGAAFTTTPAADSATAIAGYIVSQHSAVFGSAATPCGCAGRSGSGRVHAHVPIGPALGYAGAGITSAPTLSGSANCAASGRIHEYVSIGAARS
jgi:hypothetical protein